MANTKTTKKSSPKNQPKKKQTTKTSSARNTKNSAAKSDNALGREIGILAIALVAILLFLGAIDVAGDFGHAIHNVICGLFGVMGYVFPFLLAGVGIYLIIMVPRNAAKAYLKMLWLVLLFIALTCIAAMFDSKISAGTYSAAYFYEHGTEGFNGGWLGGVLATLLYPHVGVLATYVIFIFIALICIVLFTGKSILRPLKKNSLKFRDRAVEDINYAQEKNAIRREERKVSREEKMLEREEKLAARKEALSRLDKKVTGDNAIQMVDINAQTRSENASKDAMAVAAGIVGAEGFDVKADEERARQAAKDFAFEQTFKIHRHDDELSVDAAANGDNLGASSDEAGAPINAERDYRTQDEIGAGADYDSWVDSSAVGIDDINIPSDMYDDAASYAEGSAAGAGAGTGAPGTAAGTAAGEGDSMFGGSGNRSSLSGAVFSSGEAKRPAVRKKIKRTYKLPPLNLLAKSEKGLGANDGELESTANVLEETLRNFGVTATVTDISCGPTVTRYELHPGSGVKIGQIVALKNDIALALAATDIRIEAPIPGKSAVGIEVPNIENSTVYLRGLLETAEFKNAKSKLTFGLGRDISGKVIVTDIAKMPHLLIAGATGSGKSVCVNTIIMSILYQATPDEVKFIMIDPKQVELTLYSGIPHMLVPVVTDPKKAAGALNWGVAEMDARYHKFSDLGVRDIDSYNEKIAELQEEYDAIEEHEPDDERPEKLPRLVIIVDEMADLMMVAAKEVEESICRLAQLARAAGIHLVLATQRPSVKVVTGLIKANIPSRIALAVSNSIDSRIIIDQVGAESLLGKGDMLFAPQWLPKPCRIQGAWVSEGEVKAVVDYWQNQKDESAAAKEKMIAKEIASKSTSGGAAGGDMGSDPDENDELFEACGRFIIENDKGSIGNLQRRFKIGFNRAARIMDQLADVGVVGPDEGKKPRQVLMTLEEFESYIDSLYE